MKKEETVNIPIKKKLYEKTEKLISNTKFNSVEEYLNFALEEVFLERKELEEETKNSSSKDEEKIKNRLKELGYE
ncbi:CopG family transcriptional regulator [archaeon SCG-AAA382B04]|nr:CopG family transcriptional regulator [archaeon SCG-AAA382B04]